jgi:hypothetical protein
VPPQGFEPEVVVEDGAAGELGEDLGGGREPVGTGRPPRVEPERPADPVAELRDDDAVVERAGRRGEVPGARPVGREVRRIPEERAREVIGEEAGDPVVVAVGEQQQPRSPVVVGGAGRVEAQHLGAGPDERRGVAEPRKLAAQDRPDRFGVETPGQFDSGSEFHGLIVPRESAKRASLCEAASQRFAAGFRCHIGRTATSLR